MVASIKGKALNPKKEKAMKNNQKRILQAFMDDIERGEIESVIKDVLGAKMDKFLKEVGRDVPFATKFFAITESLASKSRAKVIAKHHARPDAVDDLLAQQKAAAVLTPGCKPAGRRSCLHQRSAKNPKTEQLLNAAPTRRTKARSAAPFHFASER